MNMPEAKDPIGAKALLAELANPKLGSSMLLAIWNSRYHENSLWQNTTVTEEAYRVLARRFLAFNLPLVALEVTKRGFEGWARDPQLQQLKGLALARCGATREAEAVLAAAWEE